MKLLKKMSALLVAVVMMAVTVVPAFAADENKTITNNVTGHTFAAYQIFGGTIESTDNEGKLILGNIAWGTGIDKEKFLSALKSSNDFGTPNPFASANTATDVAKAMESLDGTQSIKLAQITFNNKSSVATQIAAPTDGVASKTQVQPGFYLIVDTTTIEQGSGDAKNPAILLVNGDTEIKDKKEKTTVEKKVKDENGEWKDTADYSIGDEIEFKLSSKVIPARELSQYNTYKYVFHDTLSPGLTAQPENLPVAVTVKVGNMVVPATRIDNGQTVNQYEVTAPDANRKFTVTLPDLLKLVDANGNKISLAGQDVIIEYKAKLNTNAQIGNPGNENTVQLEYSNDPNSDGTGTTIEDKVKVFTFQLDGTKMNIVDSNDKLQGAEFVLYRTSDNNPNNTSKEYATISNGKVGQWNASETVIDKDSENYSSYKITSGEDGKFSISGLGDGTYFLQETKAPEGYNLRTEPFKIVIDSTIDDTAQSLTNLTISLDNGNPNNGVITKEDGTETPAFKEDGIVKAEFQNSMTTTLPETGGMGTTMLYVAGGILLIGSAVLLVTKKRMGHEN